MPAALATIGRQLIVMIIQTGAFIAVEKGLMSVIDKIRAHNAEVNGLDPEDADNETANTIIDIALLAGITMVSLRTKLPVKIAERLGFTSKGFVKRPLSKAGAAKLVAKGVKPATTAALKVESVEAVIETVVKTRGSSFASVSKIANIVVAVIGVPVGIGLLVVNTIDFAAWPSSSYQNAFQKFFSFFGLNPDKEAISSKVLSDDMWNKVYNTYKQLGATGINNPFTNQSQSFSKETLVGLVDKIAANIIAEKGKVTLKEIIGATQGFLVMGAPVTNEKINSVFKTSSSTNTTNGSYTAAPTITKVFTGIVSQGVVGEGLVFTARPDDLIESADELRQAAANNLAPYLNTLLGKIVYEVKVVSSIITKEGFKQTGITQRIQTGTYSNGTPKYKSVTNKFATLVVYALTDKGSRSKLTTIVLGPVDSAKLIVGQNDLRTLETELPALVTTTDINDINEIKTDTETLVTRNENIISNENETTTFKKWFIVSTANERWQVGPFLNQTAINTAAMSVSDEIYRARINADVGSVTDNNPNLPEWPGISKTNKINTTSLLVTAPVVSSTTTTTTKAGASATTLYAWYQAQGQSLPSVADRAIIYEGKGLGPRSYYTGTAEQNTKLLNALKA